MKISICWICPVHISSCPAKGIVNCGQVKLIYVSQSRRTKRIVTDSIMLGRRQEALRGCIFFDISMREDFED